MVGEQEGQEEEGQGLGGGRERRDAEGKGGRGRLGWEEEGGRCSNRKGREKLSLHLKQAIDEAY